VLLVACKEQLIVRSALSLKLEFGKMEELVHAHLPTTWGNFTMRAFESGNPQMPHLALVHPSLNPSDEVTVRIHSECMTGDVFASQRCDCGEQLHTALERIQESKGVLIYLRQEGRGIGLVNKLKAYELQDTGLDTIEANEALGFAADLRTFNEAIEILSALGIKRVKLLTNNPQKLNSLVQAGFEVSREPIQIAAQAFNEGYLNTKKLRMGHQL